MSGADRVANAQLMTSLDQEPHRLLSRSGHRTPCIAPSSRRVADIGMPFAVTLLYPNMSPLWPETLSEQRERDAGPIALPAQMLDYLGITEASAKPSDEMHSSVLQTDFYNTNS